jgi:translation initiation factor 1
MNFRPNRPPLRGGVVADTLDPGDRRILPDSRNPMNPSDNISTDGGQGLGQNPFGNLPAAGLPAASTRPIESSKAKPEIKRNRGRVDIKRTTAGRGGKTVTLVTGFTGIGLPEKESLAKKMRNACGCGGTVKDGDIEIQGDQREKIAQILSDAGFRPVFAGG